MFGILVNGIQRFAGNRQDIAVLTRSLQDIISFLLGGLGTNAKVGQEDHVGT